MYTISMHFMVIYPKRKIFYSLSHYLVVSELSLSLLAYIEVFKSFEHLTID